jgi:cysteine synthase
MFDHITDAIKAPSLVRLGERLFVARFETMKVYSALVAVERLLQAGAVDHRSTLVDSSSGIYAYALALACHKHRLKCHIVASYAVDKALMAQLQILGATVERAPQSASLKLDQNFRVQRIQELLAADPHMHWMRQYHDDIHYCGYEPVAELIRAELGTDDLSVVGAVGSGCSTAGIVQALRTHDTRVRLVGIQPFGSVTFGCRHIEDPGILIAGIGSSIPFRNVRHALYDEIHWVSFGHGLAGAVALLREHAVFAGLSTGCCHVVARHELAAQPGRRVLFISPDTGHRYADAVFTQHQEAADIRTLAPRWVTRQEELALPWSAVQWNRRPSPNPLEEEHTWHIC